MHTLSTGVVGLGHFVVHALPRGRATLLVGGESAVLHMATNLLLFVLLLLKGDLLLGVVAGSTRLAVVCGIGAGAGASVTTSGCGCLSLALVLHLLHHGGVHHVGHGGLGGSRALGVGVGAHATLWLLGVATHTLHLLHLLHLLEHGRVHTTHTHAGGHSLGLALACHSHLLLHHGEVLLHALPVLCHHLRGHSTGHALLATLLGGTFASVVHVSITSSISAASTTSSVLVTQIATGLGFLHFDGLAQDFKGSGEGIVYSGLAVEGDEAEATRTASILVNHQGRIHNTAKLHKELLEVLICCLLTDTTDKDLAGLFLLITWDGALGVNLGNIVSD